MHVSLHVGGREDTPLLLFASLHVYLMWMHLHLSPHPRGCENVVISIVKFCSGFFPPRIAFVEIPELLMSCWTGSKADFVKVADCRTMSSRVIWNVFDLAFRWLSCSIEFKYLGMCPKTFSTPSFFFRPWDCQSNNIANLQNKFEDLLQKKNDNNGRWLKTRVGAGKLD